METGTIHLDVSSSPIKELSEILINHQINFLIVTQFFLNVICARN